MSADKGTCFHEDDPEVSLFRRMLVEGVGTALLMLAAIGAGCSVQIAGDHGAGKLALAAAIASALVGLIITLGPVSGGHFNPLISGLQWLAGQRSGPCAAGYAMAQVLGALCGSRIAVLLFPGAATSSGPLTEPDLVASEVVASLALMVIVFAAARSGQKTAGPFAVGAWLFAAILATPSASYANPAIAIAAIHAAGPVALGPAVAGAYVAAEVGGALLALVLISLITGIPLMRSPHRAAMSATGVENPLPRVASERTAPLE